MSILDDSGLDADNQGKCEDAMRFATRWFSMCYLLTGPKLKDGRFDSWLCHNQPFCRSWPGFLSQCIWLQRGATADIGKAATCLIEPAVIGAQAPRPVSR